MKPRREFPKRVRFEIIKRASDEKGNISCEGCGLRLGKKAWHIDHTVAEALVVDKTIPLTAKDGKLLGWDCCHAPKTVVDVGVIAKAVRVSNRHLGIKKTSTWRKPPPGYDPWRKRMRPTP